MRVSRRIRVRGAAATIAVLLVTGCSAGSGGGSDETDASGYDTVVIAVAPWAGARANGEVAAYLLREELGVEVEVKEMETSDAWDAMHEGTVHAFLEDWLGSPDKEKRYLRGARTVVEGGDLGVRGNIGWFVPKYFADKHPDVVDWKNLNRFVEDFSAPGTGGKGRLLGAEQSWTSYDKELIENLGLDYVIEPADSEEALVADIEKHYEAGEPFLAYWQDPHWKNLELDLVEVELPEYVEGCNVPREFTDCAYADVPLQKFLHAGFERDGGEAAEFLRNFRWSNRHQNEVAGMMASGGMDGQRAAAEWAEKNRGVWQAWLPRP